MKAPIQTEAEMAARVVKWLEAEGHEVFQEVQPGGKGGHRADIVAVRAGVIRVIETKMTLNLDVMAQAADWQPFANYVLIAVPEGKGTPSRKMGHRCCAMLGIGVLYVKALWPIDEGRVPAVIQRVEPDYQEHINPYLRDNLLQEHKTHAKAGTKGGHFTKFVATCEALARIAEEKPGTSLREALAGVDHHYRSISTGVSSLETWNEKGKLAPYFRLAKNEAGAIAVYPKESEPKATGSDGC